MLKRVVLLVGCFIIATHPAGAASLGGPTCPATWTYGDRTLKLDGAKYGSDGVQHAVVFDRYETRGDQKGMVIVEQAKNMPAREKFVLFNSNDKNPRYRAENYSVIKK